MSVISNRAWPLYLINAYQCICDHVITKATVNVLPWQYTSSYLLIKVSHLNFTFTVWLVSVTISSSFLFVSSSVVAMGTTWPAARRCLRKRFSLKFQTSFCPSWGRMESDQSHQRRASSGAIWCLAWQHYVVNCALGDIRPLCGCWSLFSVRWPMFEHLQTAVCFLRNKWIWTSHMTNTLFWNHRKCASSFRHGCW